MTTLIFDFDGTLHDTISRWLGYSSRYMWDAFMPQLPETEKEICSKMIGDEMLRAIQMNWVRQITLRMNFPTFC